MKKIKNEIAKLQTNFMLRQVGLKKEDGSQLIEMLGLILVAVFLLFLFRGQIANIFNSATNSTGTELNKLFKTS